MNKITKVHLSMEDAYAGYVLSKEMLTVSNNDLLQKTVSAYAGTDISQEGIFDTLKSKILSTYQKYTGTKYFKDLTDDKYFKYWKSNKPFEFIKALPALDNHATDRFNNNLNKLLEENKSPYYIFDKDGKLFSFTELNKNHFELINSLFDAVDVIINDVNLSNVDYRLKDLVNLLGNSSIENNTGTILLNINNSKVSYDYYAHSKSSTLSKDDILKWLKDVQKGVPVLESNIKHAQNRLDAIYKLVDKLEITKRGLVSGILGIVLGLIRTTIGFIFLHLNETIKVVAKAAVSLKDTVVAQENYMDDDDKTIVSVWRIGMELLEFIASAFFAYLFYTILVFIINIFLAGILTPFLDIIVIGLTIKTLYSKYNEGNKHE